MHELFAWEGWSAVSAIAQILSLATLMVAAWRFVVARKQAPTVWVTWTYYGVRAYGRERFHTIEFHNAGRGVAHLDMLVFVGARTRLEENFVAPSVLGSGESFRLLLASPSIADVWVFTGVRRFEDFRREIVEWHPLPQGTPLAKQYAEEVAAWRRRSPLQRLRDRYRPRIVEPGGQVRATWRITSNVKRNEARSRAVNPLGDSLFSSSGLVGSDNVVDLPYYRPPSHTTASTPPPTS